ncbi:MAG: hypothetical protein U0518_02310 [Candidatus Gracilibacteria bacterium]
MRNLIASHDEIDNFIIRSINPTTIEYYYPDENPSSWTPEEYQEKYQTLTATLRRDLKYRAKAEGFSKEIHQIIQQDFPLENISISSIFRSRPTDSQEWSNIGVGVTKINQNGEKEYAKIMLSEQIDDIRTHIITQISTLFRQEQDSNVVLFKSAKDAA